MGKFIFLLGIIMGCATVIVSTIYPKLNVDNMTGLSFILAFGGFWWLVIEAD